MPEWAHFPLILGPNGKLSKRDGAKYGFPVFAMNWTDPNSKELTEGFREKGFLPEAFLNLLALLGWNDGTEKEIFSKEELIDHFSMDRVHSAGARFDYEKAKWFNHEWIKRSTHLAAMVEPLLNEAGITIEDHIKLEQVLELVKERCHLLPEFVQQTGFFFKAPVDHDLEAVRGKWNEEKKNFFLDYCDKLETTNDWQAAAMEEAFKQLAAEKNIKAGELQLPYRIMLVGGKFGPPVFQIAEILGKQETINRIRQVVALI